MSVKGGVGSFGYTFHGAYGLIRQEAPEIVMIKASPRNKLTWQLPGLCRSYGGVSVLWSKVHSATPLPASLLRAMKRKLFEHYDLAFTYGPASTRELIELGFDSNRIYTAHNTVDTHRIFRDWESLSSRATQLRCALKIEDKRILLSIARFEPEKRHTDLLAAWPRLRELDRCLILILAGSGSLSQQIHDQAKRTDPERIIFLGSLPEGGDYDWIAAADMTIHCGAVGLAINQSLASGTATIVADEPGVDAEIVRHGVTGWRYKKGDIDSLVEVVGAVLRGEMERERITVEARRFMRDEANIDRMVARANDCVNAAMQLWRERKRT
jgi:glycosyltransferase involved in cell wall biosynthesis